MSIPYNAQTASFDVSEGIFYYPCDSTNGPILATLPFEPYLWEIHTFKDCSGAASPTNPIGIDGNGKQIDGLDSISNFIQVSEGWGTVRFNGSSWNVVG